MVHFYLKLTHIINIPSHPVLPAEVNQGVVRLLDVHRAFAFIWCHYISFQGHFTGTKFHQVFAGAAPGAANQAWKESTWRHLISLLTTPNAVRKKNMLPSLQYK